MGYLFNTTNSPGLFLLLYSVLPRFFAAAFALELYSEQQSETKAGFKQSIFGRKTSLRYFAV